MTSPAEREALFAQQARAVRALTSDGDCPDLVGQRGQVAARETLVRKRVASLSRHWPALRLALGDAFGPLAREYVFTRPRLTSDGRADGRAFATWLGERGTLPEGVAADVLRFDVCYRTTAEGVRCRRLPMIRVSRRPRLMAALYSPRPGRRPPAVVLLGITRTKRTCQVGCAPQSPSTIGGR